MAFDTPKLITYPSGYKEWRTDDGKLHRTDGPAIELEDGTKEWLVHGVTHREDGPAVEWADGGKWYFLNGQQMTEDQFLDWKFIQWCTIPVEYAGVTNDD